VQKISQEKSQSTSFKAINAQTMTQVNIQSTLKALLSQLNSVIVGKSEQVQDCVACLLAGGHLLIEDVPGVGKTTLAHALALRCGVLPKRKHS
jgi:MoxR-like ATPase